MIGTEKQVAWAEEIRASFIPVAQRIHEAAAIMADTRKTVEVMTDPIFGETVTIEKYVAKISAMHEAAIRTARRWWEGELDVSTSDRIAKHGGDYRLADSERLEELASRLDADIAHEDEATFWINRR